MSQKAAGEMIQFTTRNWRRVTKRVCHSCQSEVRVKKKTVVVLDGVRYLNVPHLVCPKCGKTKEVSLVMMAAQMYAKAYGLREIDCAEIKR